MKPSYIYKQRISCELLESSTVQQEVLQILDDYYHHCLGAHDSSLLSGIYLWGSVGSGKTMLLDILYNELPEQKKRMHFHEFINRIHDEMKNVSGQEDPLKVITKKFAKHTKFLFLDELIIDDISNAIILKNLFTSLIEQKVFIIISSNIEPVDLYRHGINRELFLPAIDFIEKNFSIASLNSDIDYRILSTKKNDNYFHPESKSKMESKFAFLNPNCTEDGKTFTIVDREIPVLKLATNSIWFEFEEIISPPRYYKDYLYLAMNFQHIFISGVRPLRLNESNLIHNFCHLIDICYDKKIFLALSASCTIDDIFKDQPESKSMLRTKSRLKAMQNM